MTSHGRLGDETAVRTVEETDRAVAQESARLLESSALSSTGPVSSDSLLNIYQQVTPTTLVDALPEFALLWTRMVLDAEQGLFAPPLIQEHDFGVLISVGDLYVRHALTPGEEVAATLARGRVLELGAGFGRVSHNLRNRGHEVVTTDADADIVSMYRARGWADACQVTLPEIPESLGRFDTVIALRGVVSLAGEFDQVHRSLVRIREILNPGGRFIFTSSKVNALVPIPGRSPLEYHVRFIYRGARSGWLRATALPEWLAVPLLREFGFESIESLESSSADGAGYYGFATLRQTS